MKPRFHYGYVILVMSILAVMGGLGFSRFAYTLILPSMRDGLRLTYTQAGLLASSDLLGYMLSVVGWGVLTARVGPRRVILWGLALCGAGMLLTGLAPGFEVALLARGLSGVGATAANIAAMSMVSRWFARPRQGLASGFIVAGSPLGIVVAGQLVPSVVAVGGTEGWRYSWLLFGVGALGLWAAGRLLLRNGPSEMGLRMLWAEAEHVEDDGPSQSANPSSLGAILRSPAMWVLGLVFAAFGFSHIVYGTFFASHLLSNGLDARQAGNLWTVLGLLLIPAAPLWGTISDRLGRRETLVAVMLLQASSYAAFALGSELTMFVVSVVLFGSTASAVATIISVAAGERVGQQTVPAALGLMYLGSAAGQVVGPGLAGVMADSTGSFVSAFWLAAGVAALGALLSLALRAPRSVPALSR